MYIDAYDRRQAPRVLAADDAIWCATGPRRFVRPGDAAITLAANGASTVVQFHVVK
jgi:hypothetical protein